MIKFLLTPTHPHPFEILLNEGNRKNKRGDRKNRGRHFYVGKRRDAKLKSIVKQDG